MASKELLQRALNANFDLTHFHRNVLQPVFGASLEITSAQEVRTLNASEKKLVRAVRKYGKIKLTDYRELDLYDVELEENVIVERNKVSIGSVIKKYIIGTNAVLVNFHYGDSPDKSWRLSFIAKENEIEDGEIKKTESNPKRYTYVLGAGETCRTAAERFAKLSLESEFTVDNIKDAFSVEKLSKLFFDEYKEHYEEFVAHLNKREIKATVFKGDEKAIRDFAKKLLGRIVFLCFVQKKGWLGATNDKWEDGDKNFLQNLFIASGSNENFYPVWLHKLFYDTLNNERKKDAFELPDKSIVKIPYLNGGLFEDDEPKGILTFPKKLFVNLFEFFNQYNFTIYEDSPEEHTIAVDPEMLGHIFENLLEDNKDKGAFYTPAEIVHYMCQESITEYLFNKLNYVETDFGDSGKGLKKNDIKSKPGQITLRETQNRKNIDRAHIEDFVKNKHANDFIFSNARDIDRFLDEVKICDPAIGSGAFPMGLLHEIYQLKMVLHDFVFVTSGELFHIKDYDPLTYHARVKENIIQNSIYGVDIEKGAVDIARLRFWLSLVVDENTPRALPNLDYKIVVGDSLLPKFEDGVVDIDWDLAHSVGDMRKITEKIKNGFNEIVEKQNKFFSPKANKTKLQTEIRNLKIDLLLNQLLLDKKKYAAATAQVQDLFGSKTAEEKIKNVEAELKITGYNDLIRKLEVLKSKPNKPLKFFEWKLDFSEIMNPAKEEVKKGFDIVIGNPPYGAKFTDEEKKAIRKRYPETQFKIDSYSLFLLQSMNLLKSGGTCYYIIPNTLLDNYFEEKVREKLLVKNRIFEIIDLHDSVFDAAVVHSMIFAFQNYQENDYQIKIGGGNKLFGALSYIPKEYFLKQDKLLFSIRNFSNRFLLDKLSENSFPLEEILDIRQTIKTGNDPKYIKDSKVKSNFKPILRGKDVFKWTIVKPNLFVDYGNHLACPRDKEIFEQPKILIREAGNTITATYDDDDFYIMSSLYNGILLDDKIDLKYLLALINSKVFQYQMNLLTFEKTKGAFTKARIFHYYKLPVRKTENQKPFIKLVDKILETKKENPKADTTKWERQIDLMVYHLYNLTYAEAKIIDAELSEEEWEKFKS